MRALAVVLLVLWPVSASAQTTAADAGNDVEALQADIARDYAEALASDCAMACRALQSMQHAADRLCALDAGDRCVQAQQKVKQATERVRAACPSCEQTMGPSSPPAAAPPPAAETVALEAAPSKRGGCAGCALTPADDDCMPPLGAAATLLLALRRRRRRR